MASASVGKFALLAAVAMAAGCENALAGAWTLGEGETLVIAGASFADSAAAFDLKGRLIPVSSYRKFELGVYVERGLTDSFTLIVKPSFEDVATKGPPGGAYHGFEAMEAGARLRLAQFNDLVFSAQALVKIPAASDKANPALVGATAREIEGRLLAGYSFRAFERAAFADAQIAWTARDGGNPGEARLDLTLGVQATEAVQLLLQSFNLATTGAGNVNYPAQRASKLQASVVYAFAPGWSLQGGGFATVAAQNARRESGAVAAVWRRF